MSERKLKGGVLLGYLDFIRHKWGPEGLDECLGCIGMGFGDIDPDEFYPSEYDEIILRWISSKGMDYVKMTGNHTVKNLGSLAHLVRFVNIKHLLKRAKDNYKDAFNYGEVSILSDEFGKRAVIVMKDCNLIEESGVAWLGAFEGMLEVTRTKGTVKMNRSQAKGDDHDEFLIDWQ